VLFLAQVLPYPLDSGPKIRAYHVLRWLAARSEVHLVSFLRADDTPAAVTQLEQVGVRVLTHPIRRSAGTDTAHLVRAILGGGSFVIGRDGIGALHHRLRDLAAEVSFDAVHADQLCMAQYATALKVPFKVLDQHNAVYRVFQRLAVGESSLVRRWVLRREAVRLGRYEVNQIPLFDRLLFVTNEDRSAIASLCSPVQRSLLDERSDVMPICVDAGAMGPVEPRRDAFRVTFMGTMYWPPNAEAVLWMSRHVIPDVLAKVPRAVFTIIGRRPPTAIREVATRFGANVEVTGYVADPRPYLEETAVFAVPLRSGAGMRVKILDAWAWGLPIVSTSIGAEGIAYARDRHIVIADDGPAFAAQIVRLLTNGTAANNLRLAGHQHVRASYSVTDGYDRLHSVYESVIRGDSEVAV